MRRRRSRRRPARRPGASRRRRAAVGEVDVLEADVALDVRERLGAGAVDDVRLLVEHADDLVQGCGGREERVVELRELLDRVEEVVDVEHEGEEGRERDRVVEVEVAAVAEDDGERERREKADEREVDAVQHDRLHVRLPVVERNRAEVLRRALLAYERLHHPHAGDVLGERGRHEAEPLAHRRVGPGGARAEERARQDHERDHDEGREGEPRVEHDQEEGCAAEQQRALCERRDAVGDELVDRLDVVGHPADQDTGPVPLVEAERKLLQVAEELLAEVGQDPLPDPAGHVRLDVGHAPVREREEDEQGHEKREIGPRLAVDRVVEGVLCEERRGQRGRRRCQEREDRQEGAEAVRLREPPEDAEPATGRVPGPVLDVCSRAPRDHGADLVDAHYATSSMSALASTASANWRSSRPWS